MYEMRVGIWTKQPGHVQVQKREMSQVRDIGTFLEDLNNCIISANFRESSRSILIEVDWDNILTYVTASSGTAISTNFATLTCSEILSKNLIRCVTWHWACDCSFRCFHEIGRYFDNKEQERAKTRARRHERSQRRQEHPKIDSFWGANTGFIDFQHYATLCSENRKNESFRLKILVWCLEPLRPSL